MLVELRVRDLGVIADLDLVIGPGMTALTGETGAGKTLVVEALELLLGGRADAAMVRAGASEAVVEGRFVTAPRRGRAVACRSHAPGARAPMWTAAWRRCSRLAEIGDDLVDLHGQHAHQSLLAPGGPTRRPRRFRRDRPRAGERGAARARGHRRPPRRARRRSAGARADGRPACASRSTRSRQPRSRPPTRTNGLRAEEAVLSQVGALREAIDGAREALAGARRRRVPAAAPGASDLLGRAVAELSAHESALGARSRPACRSRPSSRTWRGSCAFAPSSSRRTPSASRRSAGASSSSSELRRKYGPSLARSPRVRGGEQGQLAELEATEETRAALEERRQADPRRAWHRPRRRLGAARREAAPKLAAAVEAHLRELALPGRPARGARRRRAGRVGGRVPPRRQPGRAGAALRQGGLGRRARPDDARHAPRALGGAAHARLRRGRRRRRRRGGPRRGPALCGARAATTRCSS